jgi:hypothetical protein
MLKKIGDITVAAPFVTSKSVLLDRPNYSADLKISSLFELRVNHCVH